MTRPPVALRVAARVGLGLLVPSLALHGIVAYAAMLATLIGIEILKRRGVLST